MGFLTTTAQVWYPAITDKMQLHTLFSTMASSIENGLGARMSKQELNKGAFLGLTSSVTLPTTSGTAFTVPYPVGAAPYYNNGMTVSGGVVTIVTPGLYQLNATFFVYQTGGYGTGTLMVNNTPISELIATPLSSGSGQTFLSGALAGSQILKAGDTVWVKMLNYNWTGTTPSLFGAAGRPLNALSVTLIKAT